MSKCDDYTKYDRGLLIGLKAIGQYCGFGEQTIRRWIRNEGFPAGMLPDGRWAVTVPDIGYWLSVRNPNRGIRKRPPGKITR